MVIEMDTSSTSCYLLTTGMSRASKYNFKSLTTLSARQLVKHANILHSYCSYIPSTLYDTLLHAAVETDRVLSIKLLVINWPAEEIIFENCKHFKPHHATLIARCLNKTKKELRKIDLSGCKTGKEGTELFLKLALNQSLPELSELYCSGCIERWVLNDSQTTDESQSNKAVGLHLMIDCYCSRPEYRMLKRILKQPNNYHLLIANLYAKMMGFPQIKSLLMKMVRNELQRKALRGLHLARNGFFPYTHEAPGSRNTFVSLIGQFRNLKYLNLSHNAIGVKTLRNILKHLHHDVQLTHLIVRTCSIDHHQTYWDEMANLKCLAKLEHLDVAYNKLQVLDGLKKMLLQCAATLKTLDVGENDFGADFIDFVKMILKPPFNLVDLNISKNNLLLSIKDLDDFNKIDCRTITF